MTTEPSRPNLGRPRRVGGEGEPEVFGADEQTDVEVALDRWVELARSVLVAEGVRGHAELSVLFVSADEIAELNQQFMDTAGPTDVLAFPLDDVQADTVAPGPGAASAGPDRSPADVADLPLLLGDVVVCPSVARDQAPGHAGSLDDELALLVVHGTLHVLGWDHDTDERTQRMQSREQELLVAHHWHGEPPAAFRQEQP
ncbi:MAG: rRNA maturation RNase YbeY [Acidimicrobiales bacterium]